LWCLSTGAARGEWRRPSDIELGTAYTLDESTLSVGILSPLSVGVTESFQASIHPLLLLLGQPSLAFRLRVTPVDDVTVATNLAGAWSFIHRQNESGGTSEIDGQSFGFPGTLQLGATVTWAASKHWLVSGGAGAAVDFLGDSPVRGLVEVHAGVHWLPSARHLVMLNANGYIDYTHQGELVRPSAQLLYAWAASSRVHLMLGLGLGDWVWEEADGGRRKVNVFPLVDVVFRF